MDDIVDFWRVASRLKSIRRAGWKQGLGLKNVESVADHTFGVAILALLEGEKRGYDVGTLLKLALVHDLEEAMTGDLTPRDKKRTTKVSLDKIRNQAIRTILGKLPGPSQSRYLRLWRDLRVSRTREARLVKSLDKLEMALQAKAYEETGIERRRLAGFYRSAQQISDPALKRVLKKIVELD